MKCVPLLMSVSLLLTGCVAYTRVPWQAGASRAPYRSTPLGDPVAPEHVALYRREAPHLFEATEGRKVYACGTTTVLRKSYLLDPDVLPAAPSDPSWEPLAELTTEEFPRDEDRSQLRGDEIVRVLGIGNDPFDLFDVYPDPAFIPDGLARLRELAAGLGADAVIDVHTTGELEHHMWLGFRLGLDPQETGSLLYTALRLLDVRLRDVRFHGTAVRRAR